jgi:hypothetical protein
MGEPHPFKYTPTDDQLAERRFKCLKNSSTADSGTLRRQGWASWGCGIAIVITMLGIWISRDTRSSKATTDHVRPYLAAHGAMPCNKLC